MSQARSSHPEASAADRAARLCVLFDASPGSLGALQAAVRQCGADQPFEVIYLDEPDWQRSAAFAFAAEIGGLSGQLRPHPPEQARQRQQDRLARARRSLRQALLAQGVFADLSVCPAGQLDQRLAGFSPADCLVLGRVGHAGQHGRRLGRLARRLIDHSQLSLWLPAPAPAPAARCVAVLLDAPDPAVLVQLARARAAALGLPLLLIDQSRAAAADDMAECYRPNYPSGAAGQAELARLLRARRAGELWVSRRGHWLGSAQGLMRLAALPVALRVVA